MFWHALNLYCSFSRFLGAILNFSIWNLTDESNVLTALIRSRTFYLVSFLGTFKSIFHAGCPLGGFLLFEKVKPPLVLFGHVSERGGRKWCLWFRYSENAFGWCVRMWRKNRTDGVLRQLSEFFFRVERIVFNALRYSISLIHINK